ncbi:hypothetical protein ACH419_36775 [Streptomyces bobili]|uniref:hypothetical protein n=1 Tax=Streptomyces bobili TaxID=67280 RepID=UPI00379E3999
MAALGGAGRQITFPAPDAAPSAGRSAVVVQSGLRVVTQRWPGLDDLMRAELLESGTAALAAMEGIEAVRTRLVAMAYPPTPAS